MPDGIEPRGDQKDIADVIKSHRLSKKWSVETLADKAGVSTRTINRAESGEEKQSTQTLELLANALNIDWNLIFGPPSEIRSICVNINLRISLRDHADIQKVLDALEGIRQLAALQDNVALGQLTNGSTIALLAVSRPDAFRLARSYVLGALISVDSLLFPPAPQAKWYMYLSAMRINGPSLPLNSPLRTISVIDEDAAHKIRRVYFNLTIAPQ